MSFFDRLWGKSNSHPSSHSPSPSPTPPYRQQRAQQAAQYPQQSSPQTPRKDPRYAQQPYLTIRWRQLEPIQIPVRADRAHYGKYTVHDVKLQCKALLNIPLATMKLQYNGGNLNDDQATLESLGIFPYSVIVVSGDQVLDEQMQQTASGNEEEVGCLSRIRKIMAESQPLLSRVSALEQQPDATQQQAAKDELLYLSEVLMRALIALDGVECPSSFTTARQERRQTVHFCQDLLDRVDALKSRNQQQKL